MNDWLYRIGVYKTLYWVGRGICWTVRWICRFGNTLRWLWLHRQLQEVIMETIKDLPKGLFRSAPESPEYDITRLLKKDNNGQH